jgi:transketolase C-terminal domain/subunit
MIGSRKWKKFAESFPDRFFLTGIAEANMMA